MGMFCSSSNLHWKSILSAQLLPVSFFFTILQVSKENKDSKGLIHERLSWGVKCLHHWFINHFCVEVWFLTLVLSSWLCWCVLRKHFKMYTKECADCNLIVLRFEHMDTLNSNCSFVKKASVFAHSQQFWLLSPAHSPMIRSGLLLVSHRTDSQSHVHHYSVTEPLVASGFKNEMRHNCGRRRYNFKPWINAFLFSPLFAVRSCLLSVSELSGRNTEACNITNAQFHNLFSPTRFYWLKLPALWLMGFIFLCYSLACYRQQKMWDMSEDVMACIGVSAIFFLLVTTKLQLWRKPISQSGKPLS